MDEITLSIVQNRLNLISEEMGIVMIRTAQSPLFSESHDFSCYVSDATGQVLAYADGLPIHTGGGGLVLRRCIEYWGSAIAPGDMFIQNDPYDCLGGHLPDVSVVMPVFHGERLLGYACNRAHQTDVGGRSMGSYDGDASEIFQEGLRLPPMKLYERGRLRRDVWDLILLNTRVPQAMAGDLGAMIGTCRIGGRRLLALGEEYGLDNLAEGMAALLDYGERLMRHHLSAIPDGAYSAVEYLNNDGVQRVDVPIKVAITVDGSNVTVDFTGSAPPTPRYKNSPFGNTCSATYLGLRTVLDPLATLNEGAYRAVKIVAPENTIVNSGPPHAVAACTTHPAWEIVHAIWRALAPVIPDQVSAGWGRTCYPLTTGEDASGERYVFFHWGGMGGGGATAHRDGPNQVGHLTTLGKLTVPSFELWEQLYPVHFLRHEFRRDGGGPGKHRGGTGVSYVGRVEGPGLWSFRGEGLYTPSGFGVAGGKDSPEGTLRLTDLETGEELPYPQVGTGYLPPALIDLQTPGGGGWGDPLERGPALVREDVVNGLVSEEAALRDYGVALSGQDRQIDSSATDRIRTDRSAPLRRQRRS